jgi:hypothetical protein
MVCVSIRLDVNINNCSLQKCSKNNHILPQEIYLRLALQFFSTMDSMLVVCMLIKNFVLVCRCHISCKIRTSLRDSLLSREGSLSCYTYCDTGPQLLWSYLKESSPFRIIFKCLRGAVVRASGAMT